MIPLLVNRIATGNSSHSPKSPRDAALQVLSADPLDLILHMEQLWELSQPWGSLPVAPAARQMFWNAGAFVSYLPVPGRPAWDHLGYSYALENTRIIQILKRVVREYRAGEALGIPKPETRRWLDATEALLFGAANPFASWLSTSAVRPDAEAVRRNAYWRLLGLDLAFGDDRNQAAAYDRAATANTGFVQLLEELLYELWRAMSNEHNIAGENASDDDRIFRLAEELCYVLRSRRQKNAIGREEAAAALALGWAELTVAFNTPVVSDLGVEASSAAARLQLMGEKVGLPAHSKSAAFFPMAPALSKLLSVLEEGVVTGPDVAWVLYLETKPTGATADPIGSESRRVITEWSAATGRDLKARSRPVAVDRPRLVAVR
jgi:hypothetical protein